jgi:hypothetical protein
MGEGEGPDAFHQESRVPNVLAELSARILGAALRGVVGLVTSLVEQHVGGAVPLAEPGFVRPSVPSARVRWSSTPTTPIRSESDLDRVSPKAARLTHRRGRAATRCRGP